MPVDFHDFMTLGPVNMRTPNTCCIAAILLIPTLSYICCELVVYHHQTIFAEFAEKIVNNDLIYIDA